MRTYKRELGLKLEGIARLRWPDKIGKVCWLFTYCVMALASKNPKMVFLELAKCASDVTRKLGWLEKVSEKSIIDLIINGDMFQVEIISTGEVIRGKKFLSRLDWNGHYYIEIYPEYYPFIKNTRRWCVDQLREISSGIESEEEEYSLAGNVRRILGGLNL